MNWIKTKLFNLGLRLIIRFEDYGVYDVDLEDLLEDCICDNCQDSD